MGSKKVSIFYLFFENIYVNLSITGRDLILKKAIEKYVTLSRFPDKKLYDILLRLKLNKKISIKNLLKLIDDLKIPKAIMEQSIINITSVKNTNIGLKSPNLPFDFNNKETARIIAGILGDGSLSSNLLVDYHNQNKNLINLMSQAGKKVFGKIDEKLYLKKDKTYQLHWPKIMGIFLFHIGLQPGYQTKTNPNIPSFIMDSSKKIKSTFLRQFFNDEGNVRLKDRRLQVKQAIVCNKSKKIIKNNIEKYCPNILRDIHFLLLDFNIKSKISLGDYRPSTNCIKTDWELSIYGKENLEMFNKHINFDISYKKDLLKKSISSYKFPSAPRDGRLNFALEHCKITQMKYGFIRKDLLAKEANRSLKTSTYYLVDLKKKGLVDIIKKPRTKKGHFIPFLYKLK